MNERRETSFPFRAARRIFLAVLLFCALVFTATGAEEVIGPIPPKPRRTPRDFDLALAERYAMDRFYDQAVEMLEKAAAKEGATPRLLRIAGLIAQFSGTSRYTERLYALFEKGAKAGFEGWNPETFRAYGQLLLDTGRKDEFLEMLRHVSRLGKDENERGEYKGALMEPIGNFFTSLGLPWIGGEEMISSLWSDWEGEAQRYLDLGRALADAGLYPDAIVAFRRAELLASDPSEARLELARCWLAVGEYDMAARAAEAAGDAPGAAELLEKARKKVPPEGGAHPELSPGRVGYVSALMPPPEMHFIRMNDRYIAGITPAMGILVLDRKTMRVAMRDSWHNEVPPGKRVEDVPLRHLFCQKLLLDGDLLAACYIDEATKGAEGLVRMYRLPKGELLAEIPLKMTVRTFEAVELVKGRLLAVQSKGSKVWLSVYAAESGKLLWRKSGYDDLVCPPLAVGDDVVVGLATLGMGSLIRFSLKDGTKRWKYNYDYARVAPQAKVLHGLGGDQAADYNPPMTGTVSEGKCWLAVKRKDGRTEFVGIDPETGKEAAVIKPPTEPAGGFKKAKGRLLYIDSDDRMCMIDDSGKLLWRFRNQALHVFFDMTEDYVALPEMEGTRLVETDTGKTLLFLKNVPEARIKGRTLYTPKMVFDLSRPREQMSAYVRKLYDYALGMNRDFDHDRMGAEEGRILVSQGERLLKDFQARQPGLPETDLALARLCKGKYYSYEKEYFNSWMEAYVYEPDRLRAAFEEFAPDFDFRWIARCDSFTGAWDEKGIAYTDLGLKAVMLADPDMKEKLRIPAEFDQGYITALTPKAMVYFYPGGDNARGTIHCVMRDTGKEAWRKDYPWYINTRQMKWHKGRLYVFTKTGGGGRRYEVTVHCLDPATGDEIWSFRPTRPVAAGFFTHHLMDFDDEGVYFGSTDAAVYKLGLADGKVIWRADSVGMREHGRPDCNFGTVKVVGDRVFTHATDGRIYCLSAKDGSIIWTARIPARIRNMPEVRNGSPEDTYWVADPVAAGGGVFMAVLNYAGQRSVLAFDMETGEFRWEFKRMMILFNSMLVDEKEGAVYIPVFASGIEKVSLADGSLLEHIPLQVSVGFKLGREMLFDMSGRLMKVVLKEKRK